MMGEPRLAQHIGAHFDHVLVDEYQDTNRLQAEILHALKPDGPGLTVVGDDAQAIYSFRAAAVDNILGFAERFEPRAEVVTLAQNYRSTQQVLDAANALMAEAPRQHRKHLLSIRGPGSGRAPSRSMSCRRRPSTSAARCCGGARPTCRCKRQAVLFRSASHSDLLEVELARRKIPFVKYGGLRFLEAAHVKDLLSVLRWADNPRNTLAAFRVLQLLPGMGPANAQRGDRAPGGRRHSVRVAAVFKPPQTPRRWTGEKLIELMLALADPRAAVARPGAPGARVVPAAPRAHLRAVPHPRSATSISSSCSRDSTPRASASSPS